MNYIIKKVYKCKSFKNSCNQTGHFEYNINTYFNYIIKCSMKTIINNEKSSNNKKHREYNT